MQGGKVMARSPVHPHNRRHLLPAAALAGIAGLGMAAAHGDPLPTRNQNPLLAPYGLPSPLPSRLPAAGGGEVGVTLNWANAAVVEDSGPNAFTMDGETQDVRLRWEQALGPRFAFVGELPWRRLSGGSLDHVIEQWHSLWGLPDGDRKDLPRNNLLIEYRRYDALLLEVDRDASGIADIPLSVGYQIAASDQHALATWLTVKAPVGDAKSLTGSGATDVALSLSGQTQLAEHWHIFGQADAVWLGQGDILPQLQQSFAWSALAGVSWNAWRALDLTVQFAANSRIFDAPTHLAGDAVVLSFGGSYRTAGGWRFDVGMSEDIQVDASPDANFIFSVRRGY
jgi:hypothetical protein